MSGIIKQTVVSAPGKIILMGEHAAVYGHPAVVAAIDLRLTVSVSAREDKQVMIACPQLDWATQSTWTKIVRVTNGARKNWLASFGPEPTQLENYQPPTGSPDLLVLLALGESLSRVGAPRLGVDIKITSELPLGSGFGSSAALAAGVAAAYLRFAGIDLESPERTELLKEISLEVERRQHGTPSGVDNTAVLQGGVLWAQPGASGEVEVTSIPHHAGLMSRLRVFHSGAPAESTGVLVAAVRTRIKRAHRRFKKVLLTIDQATRDLKDIMLGEHEESSRLIALIKTAEAALEELGVVPEPIRRIIRKIEEAGGAAKISGAGALSGEGGGSILVYHPDPDAMSEWDFLAGWHALPVRLGTEGLRAEGGR